MCGVDEQLWFEYALVAQHTVGVMQEAEAQEVVECRTVAACRGRSGSDGGVTQ